MTSAKFSDFFTLSPLVTVTFTHTFVCFCMTPPPALNNSQKLKHPELNYLNPSFEKVHERTAQIDIIMGLLKKILRKRRDLRLVISSATVDAEYIRDFFNEPDNKAGKEKEKEKAAILSVEGTNYSVDVFYAKDPWEAIQ